MSRGPRRPPVGSLTLRRRLLLLAFGLAGTAVLARAFQLQALETERWTEAALEQQRERVPLPARRGTIYDRDGVALALSQETYRISIAPRELRDRRAVAKRIQHVLGVSEAEARRLTDRQRRWAVVPGRFSAEQRKALGTVRGIYYERRLERFYPQGSVGREVIGVVTADGRALGGIEQQFDAVLSGTPGYSVMRRDARGEAAPAISLPVVPPRDGADVRLTIDLDLQEIADGALREAVEGTSAAGGDLMILDPRTGEILAAVSYRGGRSSTLAAITEPYEPGSTLKPFIVAALLAEGRADWADEVDGEKGRWRDPNGRIISDTKVMDTMTLRESLIESSNIGTVKFASRLGQRSQYEYLRDFGFGTPTGVAYPSEAGGRLRRPDRWSKLSAASLAMGYELSVTPLQLTLAYGALANGGVLMEPLLVREVRSATGEPIQRTRPRQVRRIVPEEIARGVTEVLVEVVEEGTATRASLASFSVAGKTGTARRTGAGGRYEAGAYTSTFVSYFPAQAPQVVILVKLDRPQGAYYGGLTAAPVTRETLQGILAAHTSGLDGRSLLAARLPAMLTTAALPFQAEESEPVPATERPAPASTVLDLDAHLAEPAPVDARTVPVPELSGLRFRDAVRRAHSAGLLVRLEGSGRVKAVEPAAGEPVSVGDTVVLIGEAVRR